MVMFEKRPWAYHVATPLLLGLVFGFVEFIQASGSFRDIASFITRPVLAAVLIWLFMVPTTALINGAFTQRHVPLLPRLLGAAVIGCIPLSVIIPWLLLKLGINGANIEDLNWMPLAVYDDLLIERYFRLLLIVAPIWCALTYKWYQNHETGPITEQPDPTSKPETTPGAATPPAFLDKMTKPIGRTPWAIKAEQHYIRIYTEQGDEMVLYRFSDAVKNLDGFDGLQVHRSYWIAKNAVDRLEPTDKAYTVHLKNALEIPVSRSYKKDVEAALLAK